MVDQTEHDDVDKYYVDRISKHINFLNNDESLKLFRQYRDKILKKQIREDNKRFRTEEFLETSYRRVKETIPDLDITPRAGAILFAKYVLGAVLEIIAYREASMSFMLQIYENEMKLEPRKSSKPNLKLIK